jgi:hypothetical protein
VGAGLMPKYKMELVVEFDADSDVSEIEISGAAKNVFETVEGMNNPIDDLSESEAETALASFRLMKVS